jgi:hypothetical protein
MEYALSQGGVFLPAPKITDTVRERTRGLFEGPKRIWSPAEHLMDEFKKIGLLFAGLSDAVERKVADSHTGKTNFAVTAPTYLALCTTLPTDTDTAGTLVEATYTGYARLSFAAADWNAAGTSSGTTTATAPVAQKTFGAVTAGSSTCVGWGRTSSSAGAGDLLMLGSLTSVTFSTTQTPPTVAIGALVETWD